MSFDFETVPDGGTRQPQVAPLPRPGHHPDVGGGYDFRAPACVLEALHARVEHGVFGYAVPPEGLWRRWSSGWSGDYQWRIEPS